MILSDPNSRHRLESSSGSAICDVFSFCPVQICLEGRQKASDDRKLFSKVPGGFYVPGVRCVLDARYGWSRSSWDPRGKRWPQAMTFPLTTFGPSCTSPRTRHGPLCGNLTASVTCMPIVVEWAKTIDTLSVRAVESKTTSSPTGLLGLCCVEIKLGRRKTHSHR